MGSFRGPLQLAKSQFGGPDVVHLPVKCTYDIHHGSAMVGFVSRQLYNHGVSVSTRERESYAKL